MGGVVRLQKVEGGRGGWLGQVQMRSEPTLTPPSTLMVETSNICRSWYLYLYANIVWRPVLMRNNVEHYQHYKVFSFNYDGTRAWKEVAAGGNGRNCWSSLTRPLNVLFELRVFI